MCFCFFHGLVYWSVSCCVFFTWPSLFICVVILFVQHEPIDSGYHVVCLTWLVFLICTVMFFWFGRCPLICTAKLFCFTWPSPLICVVMLLVDTSSPIDRTVMLRVEPDRANLCHMCFTWPCLLIWRTWCNLTGARLDVRSDCLTWPHILICRVMLFFVLHDLTYWCARSRFIFSTWASVSICTVMCSFFVLTWPSVLMLLFV